MLEKGSKTITVPKPPQGRIPYVAIEADASFSCYGVKSGKRVAVLPPFGGNKFAMRCRIPEGVNRIEVATAKSTFWQITFTDVPDGREYPDQTPVEIPAGYGQPLSLRDEMRRFIREEMSNQALVDGHETFEESDDFDIDDEDDYESPYTMQDMQEIEPIEELEAEGEAQPSTESQEPDNDSDTVETSQSQDVVNNPPAD